MAERTLTVSSAGKTFSFTGWKVGWVCGPAPLVAAVRTVKQFLTYVNGAPFQPAVALGLGLPDEYFTGAAAALRDGRDRLCAGLAEAGFEVFRPHATYFAVAGVERARVPPTGWRSAGSCRTAAAWWPSRRRPSTTTPASPGRWCASPSASSPMSWTRPSPLGLGQWPGPPGPERSARHPGVGVVDQLGDVGRAAGPLTRSARRHLLDARGAC